MEDETIPRSNISDLISDAVRARKNFNPTRSTEFFRVLSKMNIPEDLVENAERWRDMQASPLSRIGEDVSKPKRTSPYSQSLVNRRKPKSEQTGEQWFNY